MDTISFWIIAAVILALTVGTLMVSLRRGRGLFGRPVSRAATERTVYRDQLAEIERDLARGTLDETEASRARTEVSRRLIDSARSTAFEGARAQTRGARLTAALMGTGVVLGALGLYLTLGTPRYIDLPLNKRLQLAEEFRQTRPSQAFAETEVKAAGLTPRIAADPELEGLVAQLRRAVQDRPDDLEGLRLLARNEAALGNFSAAHVSQSRMIALKGDAASATDFVQLADMLVIAANGYVSPEAEAALSAALKRDPQNAAARYYTGLMFDQTARPDLAFQLWEPLLNGAPDAPWIAPIRANIERLAADAGLRYTLPPLKGPTAEDIENAAQLSPQERAQMIASMIESLSARLANEGGNAREWAQLITALGVTGERARASAIWEEAQGVFALDAEGLQTVRDAAKQAGVAP